MDLVAMPERELEKVEGTVEDVVYHNPENGFTVMMVSVGEELLTVVGETEEIGEGEDIAATGYFTSHPTYGSQFKAQVIERTLPSTAGAIRKYLSSGAVKGIGPATAKRLVAYFGDETLTIMEKEPERLSEVPGISEKKAQQIGEEYQRLFGIRSVMLFLGSYGIQPAMAIRIWKRWGTMAQEMVQSNPYLLCDEEIGLSFLDADKLAEQFGLEQESHCRVTAGITFILQHNSHSGHTCLPMDKLTGMAAEYLQVDKKLTEDTVLSMEQDNTLVFYEKDGRIFVYLSEYYRAESYIAGRIALMMSIRNPEEKDYSQEIDRLEQMQGITYDSLQRKAISEALNNPVFILTGGPGTGKTTTLNAILTLLELDGVKVAPAAPTGRAAKRMAEVTGREAKTIHRLLEVDAGKDLITFRRNEKNPIAAGAVVIDEMSMVDCLILERLFRGMKMNSRLIMVGDSDQLPSVSAGNLLKDLIDSEVVPTVHLDRVFRQAAQSLIVTNAHAIVRGELPELKKRDNDFFFLARRNAQETVALTVDLCARRLPNSYQLSPMWDIQVIVPGRKGAAGTEELNKALQAALNPASPEKSEFTMLGRIFREGDKVMQIRNNYDILWKQDDGEDGMGVYNGDIGMIEKISPIDKAVFIRFDDKTAVYPMDNMDQIEHAYAITVHKSQGSEFEAVVMPLTGRHPKLHYRNLLYTGVTRAKKLLVLAGSAETVQEMVMNNRRTLRYTCLKEMLRQAVQGDGKEENPFEEFI